MTDDVDTIEDRIAGALLGTALGDALGLACEGMSAAAIARRFGRVERFHVLGRTGFVSDDTEQTALLVQSALRAGFDPDGTERQLRRALAGWLLRLPWGVGLSTLKACLLILLGVRASGRRSAGNGAAMRAGGLGAILHDRPALRAELVARTARLTHVDPRAVAGAAFVAELAAVCVAVDRPRTLSECVSLARAAAEAAPELLAALTSAVELAAQAAPIDEAAGTLGTSGYVVHTVAFAVFCLLAHGDEPLPALSACVGAGGDTDSTAAILGGWLGAWHGAAALPAELMTRIQDGPFGPTHLRALARAAVSGETPPRYSRLAALVRNVSLYPVVIGHGLRRLLPW